MTPDFDRVFSEGKSISSREMRGFFGILDFEKIKWILDPGNVGNDCSGAGSTAPRSTKFVWVCDFYVYVL